MNQTNIVIVGGGITGLSLAYDFKRAGAQVLLLSASQLVNINSSRFSTPFGENTFPLHLQSASQAAAANLALRAQQFARDPHFALKLAARKIFRRWLQGIEALSEQKIAFKEGKGCDAFASVSLAQTQWSRILQDREELKKRNLQEQDIALLEQNTLLKVTPEQNPPEHSPLEQRLPSRFPGAVVYGGEAWVHGLQLLTALHSACSKLGVAFQIAEVANWTQIILSAQKYFAGQNSSAAKINVIFATGAGSESLLNALSLQPEEQAQVNLFKKPRYSAGSTFVSSKSFKSPYVLLELADAQRQAKVTLSGNEEATFLSSTTLRVAQPNVLSQEEKLIWARKNNELIELSTSAQDSNVQAYGPLNQTSCSDFAKVLWGELEERHGLRVGFGHKELLVAKLAAVEGTMPPAVQTAVLCAGAHKSGFLYAPILAQHLLEQNLIS